MLTSAGGKKRNPTIDDFIFPAGLPTMADLPCSSDEHPDSELQQLTLSLLKSILMRIWDDRPDYLFAIDMGFYYSPTKSCLVPDACLSLGVDISRKPRDSFVLWEELVIPLLAIDMVCWSSRREQARKFNLYQKIGVLYCVVYSPLRTKKAKLEIYKLIGGEYVLQVGVGDEKRIWMPEVGLAIGCERGLYDRTNREWLYWYDEAGARYLTPWEGEENEAAKAKAQRANAEKQRADAEATRAKAEKQRADAEATRAKAEEQRADAEAAKNKLLADRLRELGVDPDLL
jgi:Uma2 family endonuclease